MKEITSKTAALYAQGELIAGSGDERIREVITDSRKSAPGILFVAICGENHDAHSFLESAFLAGTAAVLVSDRKAALDALSKAREKNAKVSPAIILVNDTVEGLGRLAHGYIETLNLKKVGVTGSTGKTSTKDMLHCVLSEKYRTVKTQGNFNNEIGMPLTVLSIDEETEAVVLEMGMSAFGEIHYLVDIARPEIGVITNVGISHMEILGSRQGILKAKLEITDYFDKDNLLIIYDDGDVLSRSSAAAKGSYRLWTAGSLGSCDFKISGVRDRGADGIEYKLGFGGRTYDVALPAPGKHNAINATLALAAGLALDVDIESGIRGLSKLELTSGRLSVKEAGGVRVIDDTYNASPDSMKAGLDVLSNTEGERRVAILGDMYELGDESEMWHRQVGEFAAEKKINLVIAIGEIAKAIAEGAKAKRGAGEVVYFAEKADFIEKKDEYIKKGDVILVKASRGMHMEEIVKAITE